MVDETLLEEMGEAREEVGEVTQLRKELLWHEKKIESQSKDIAELKEQIKVLEMGSKCRT